MSKYGIAVEKLVALFRFLQQNSITISRTMITGNIGEWLVMDQLIERGYSPELQSGQYDVDITLEDGTRVEVKSATRKPRRGGMWGFDHIDLPKFDYLVCVKLSRDYSDAEYLVLSEEDALSLPPRSESDFTSNDDEDERRVLHVVEELEGAKSEKSKRINEQLDEYVGSWHKLPSME